MENDPCEHPRCPSLSSFHRAVSGWGCSRHDPWATEPFLSFPQTFKLLLMKNQNTGALLCTMSSTTAWAKRSTRPPQVCWLTVSPILPTIRTASALGCSPTLTGTPPLRTPGDTSGKVSLALPPCACPSLLPLEATVIPVAKAKRPDAAVWSIFQIHIIWKEFQSSEVFQFSWYWYTSAYTDLLLWGTMLSYILL